jgi:hypothetical protein
MRYDTVLSRLHLDTLHGAIVALYSNGYEVRAKALDRIIKNCSLFYDKQFAGVVFNPQVCILDSGGWAKVVQTIPNSIGVYGMPDAEPAVNKIFLAADKKAVASLVGMADNLPDSVLSPFDYIALHELGHIFLHTYLHTHTQKKWADEFLASYFALCYLKQINDSLGLPQLDQTGFVPKYKDLKSFEQLYEAVGPPNYAWYQGKFQKLATALYPVYKVRLIRVFAANFAANGKKTDPLLLLQQIAPGIINQWLAEMKQ